MSGALPISGTRIPLRAGGYAAEIATVGASLRSLTADGRDLVVPFAEDEVRPLYRGVGARAVAEPRRRRPLHLRRDGAAAAAHRAGPRPRPARPRAAGATTASSRAAPSAVTLETALVAQAGYPHPLRVEVEYRLGRRTGSRRGSPRRTRASTGRPTAPPVTPTSSPAPAGSTTGRSSSRRTRCWRSTRSGSSRRASARSRTARSTSATARRIGDLFIDHAFTGPPGAPRARRRGRRPRHGAALGRGRALGAGAHRRPARARVPPRRPRGRADDLPARRVQLRHRPRRAGAGGVPHPRLDHRRDLTRPATGSGRRVRRRTSGRRPSTDGTPSSPTCRLQRPAGPVAGRVPSVVVDLELGVRRPAPSGGPGPPGKTRRVRPSRWSVSGRSSRSPSGSTAPAAHVERQRVEAVPLRPPHRPGDLLAGEERRPGAGRQVELHVAARRRRRARRAGPDRAGTGGRAGARSGPPGTRAPWPASPAVPVAAASCPAATR